MMQKQKKLTLKTVLQEIAKEDEERKRVALAKTVKIADLQKKKEPQKVESKWTPSYSQKRYYYKSGFHFDDLDDEVRRLMLDEVEYDVRKNRFYISKRLNEKGQKIFKDCLIRAIEDGNEKTLEDMLPKWDYFKTREIRDGRSVFMPKNAPKLLSQTVFNRYYIRAVCLKAIKEGIETVTIYRARNSRDERCESERKIGDEVDAKDLLEDLRNPGKPTIIPEINSGLSVRI